MQQVIEKRKTEHFGLLASLIKYPKSEAYIEQTKACYSFLCGDYPEAAARLKRFHDYVVVNPLYKIEEIFTKTFHIQAICYLDLGYVLFGEDYKRGAFLVNMKAEQAQANNDCGEELADNLANALTLLPKLKDEEFINELAVQVIIPAMKRMVGEFNASRMALRTEVLRKKHKALLQENLEYGNIYKNVLEALLLVFEKDFADVNVQAEVPKTATGEAFLGGCGSGACALKFPVPGMGMEQGRKGKKKGLN